VRQRAVPLGERPKGIPVARGDAGHQRIVIDTLRCLRG